MGETIVTMITCRIKMEFFVDLFILIPAAFLAGFMNAIAGGGSFICFPALIATGMPPIVANMTNCAALWPANLSAVWHFRREIKHNMGLFWFVILFCVGIGSLIGTLLLTKTPEQHFNEQLPYLLLIATLLFAVGPSLAKSVSQRRYHPYWRWLVLIPLTFLSIYGGYFGGGMSLVVLACLSLCQLPSTHALNGMKNLITCWINLLAIIYFSLFGSILWSYAMPMAISSAIGGMAGSHLSRHLPARWFRMIIIALGLCLSFWFAM
jgi:uncharacterized membrane protein YfcA